MPSIIEIMSYCPLAAVAALALLSGCAAGADRPATASSTAQCDTQSIDSRQGRISTTLALRNRCRGGFGTFDNIENVRDVRVYLAVEYAWKPEIDQVVTYEVIKTLPVKIGPIGPQADPHGCAWLPGRWSQLQLTVPPANRIDYLRVVSLRPIK